MTTEALHPRARAPQQEKPLQWEDHVPQPESIPHSPAATTEKPVQQWRPRTAKNQINKTFEINFKMTLEIFKYNHETVSKPHC